MIDPNCDVTLCKPLSDSREKKFDVSDSIVSSYRVSYLLKV
jgi:hypothetical protein